MRRTLRTVIILMAALVLLPGTSLGAWAQPLDAAAPAASLAVDPTGIALRDGSARITGTYACTSTVFAQLGGSLSQTVGRTKITGTFAVVDVACDGSVRPWEAYVTPTNGLFAGGKADYLVAVFACDQSGCVDAGDVGTVKLNRGKLR
ncbi:MAG: DUF6299 family protein [Actinomycetes bacterium]